MNDFRYLYYLTRADRLGSVRIKKLLDHFGDAARVFDASAGEITAIEGFSSGIADAILRSTGRFAEFEQDYSCLQEKSEKLGVTMLTFSDDLYPPMLKEIYDPPVILYVRTSLGEEGIKKLGSDSVGIVGTRKPTDYGKKMAELFAKDLTRKGINVISGFARGIDTCAHKAALASRVNGTVTAAVFGCGIDVIYPPENKKLYDEMLECGVLVSEYEIGSKPDSMNFPKRNRIISGLSKGVLIIESGLDGGALITAQTALDQGREIFAVPGYVTSKSSEGTNYLIKSSQAKLVENVDDVLSEFGQVLKSNDNDITQQVLALSPALEGNEKTVFELISSSAEPVHIDAISEQAELNISDCLVTLLNLEFKGIINQLPGKRFSIAK